MVQPRELHAGRFLPTGLCRYWLAAAQRPVRGDSAERQGRCALTTNLP